MKKRTITIFKHPNDPYIQALRDGMEESPSERFQKFLDMRQKFRYFMSLQGPAKPRKITIRPASWI